MKRQKLRKLRRFHRDVYFPPWVGKSFQEFSDNIRARSSITFSLHAVEKTQEYAFEYGRKMLKFLSKSVREGVLQNGTLFEFYALDEEIKKACVRISSDSLPEDLVLVVSSEGVVITVFITKKSDNHDTLDETLYERK